MQFSESLKKNHQFQFVYKNGKSYIIKITHSKEKAYKLLKNVDPNDVRPEYVRKKLIEVRNAKEFGKPLTDLSMSKENKPIIELIKRKK